MRSVFLSSNFTNLGLMCNKKMSSDVHHRADSWNQKENCNHDPILFRWIHNQNEKCHHDPIPFNLKGNGNLFF